MNADTWHVERMRWRVAAALFGAGVVSRLIELAEPGLRALLGLLHPIREWRVFVFLVPAIAIVVGLARRHDWARSAGIVVAGFAAVMGVRFAYQVGEAMTTLAEAGQPVAVPAYALPVVTGRRLAFAAGALLLLVGQPGKRRVVAGAVFAAAYLVLVVLESTLPFPTDLSATR